MTPNTRHSLQPLTVYTHLHRDSQCCSCSTVMPGDICFNCGRLSTLLITPRPPCNLIGRSATAPEGLALAKKEPVIQNKPFDSQSPRSVGLATIKKGPKQPCPEQCAFDSQLNEIDALLDAKEKLTSIRTLAAKKLALLKDRIINSSFEQLTSSSRPCSNSITSHSTSFLDSKSSRSDSIAVSDILSESGRPHAHVAERWLEEKKSSRRSDAKLTRRGVDCRLNMHGRVSEWVIFL